MKPVDRETIEWPSLDRLSRDDESARLLLYGLYKHYIEAAATGRLERWGKAAHGIIDLLNDPDRIPFVKRRDL